MGYSAVRAAIRDALGVDLGGTTGDDRFTFLPSVCLGDCNHAPVLMVDEDLHRDVRPDGVGAVLERYE